jgi:pimeloyl-ACP methyl ester carboxylesterase
MSVVLLHGNPETPAVWAPLLAQLGRSDVHTPNLPGFGVAATAGFGATKEDYADWFTGVVEGIVATEGPIDLVGHDWGGGIGMRVVATRPELFRSWVCDVLGLFHPDYVWHDFAQIWQTPGAGEDYFAQMNATPVADRAALLVSIGIPQPTAGELAEAGDEEMGRCVLALYRSAAQPAMAAWGGELDGAGTRPGLALVAPDDPFVRSTDLAPQVAARLGARVVELTGQGHWWMLNAPALGARVLSEFWASL